MRRPSRRSLRALTLAATSAEGRLSDPINRIVLGNLRGGSSLGIAVEALRGCSVLILTTEQLPAVLAAIELDGIARRILLCPPGLDPAHLPGVVTEAQVDVVVSDPAGSPPSGPHRVVACRGEIDPTSDLEPDRSAETEWVLFTSGTTGRPKLVAHTLQSLSGPLDDGLAVASGAVWSTFYDVRRYGGLQILLRALIGGGSMVLSSAEEETGGFLARAAAAGVTHISGTPSHWRRALMSPLAERFAPAYVRLSGEVADQTILDNLRLAFPTSNIAHAFASTEAGVAFDVRDGLAGFPASFVDQPGAKAEMRVEDGTLRIRSSRTASRYLGDRPAALRHRDGFVDTGDVVERRGDRYYFVGRRDGVINVGGLKVHPEEVEAVINQHPDIQMSRVWARGSPITGAIVAADVVVRSRSGHAAAPFASIREEVLDACRRALAAYKVPVTVRQVAALEIGASGKLLRQQG